MNAINITAAAPADRIGWAADIADAWNTARDRIIDVGRRLIEAKAALPHGTFKAMIEGDLPFGPRTAQRLMKICDDKRLSNATHASLLPASWMALYELTRLDDDTFGHAIEAGDITPEMTRQDAVRLRRVANNAPEIEPQAFEGGTVGDLAALADSGGRFGVVLADPPWPFETWSEKGKDRSPERHYDTMTLKEIQALPVRALAAKDCVLFLWVTMPQLVAGIDVLEAWGFTYKTSAFVWVKQKKKSSGLFTGTGMWTRSNVELCLLGTRGSPARQAKNIHQVIEAPVGRHSEKPAQAHERIEKLVGGPYLELFSRQEREGWTVWGNEVTPPTVAGKDETGEAPDEDLRDPPPKVRQALGLTGGPPIPDQFKRDEKNRAPFMGGGKAGAAE